MNINECMSLSVNALNCQYIYRQNQEYIILLFHCPLVWIGRSVFLLLDQLYYHVYQDSVNLTMYLK